MVIVYIIIMVSGILFDYNFPEAFSMAYDLGSMHKDVEMFKD